MLNLGTVPLDQDIHIPLPTRGTDGAAEAQTWLDADFTFFKDGSSTAATIDAAATTPANNRGSQNGRGLLTIDPTQDTDFTAGSFWEVWAADTIDAIASSEPIAVFRFESAADLAIRKMSEGIYGKVAVIATVTSNSTTAINCAEVFDANTADAAKIGQILLVIDVTNDAQEWVVITAVSSGVATVERIGDGGAMGFTVAAGDWVIPVQGHPLDYLTDIETKVDANQTDLNTIITNIAALNDLSAADILTTALTESYGTDGSALTLSQLLYLIYGLLGDFDVSGTTLTVRQLDGTTAAATFTLDSASAPTDITRST